jgi:hypothetical protein
MCCTSMIAVLIGLDGNAFPRSTTFVLLEGVQLVVYGYNASKGRQYCDVKTCSNLSF